MKNKIPKLKATKKQIPAKVKSQLLANCKECNDTGWVNLAERCVCVRKWDTN